MRNKKGKNLVANGWISCMAGKMGIG